MITKKELESVYWLRKELKMWEERRSELEADICPPVKQITGMPFANTNEVNSPTEDKAMRLMECAASIDAKMNELNKTIMKVEAFIISLDDSQMRMILEMRCIGCYSWKRISSHLGDGYTSEAVRQIYHRFVKGLR